MALLNVFFKPFEYFIPKDFREAFRRMSLIDKFVFLIINLVDKMGILWHRLPVILGLVYLGLRRRLYQEYNLIDVGKTTAEAGASGAYFGRNILPVPQTKKVTRPDPMVVATKLLARRKLVDTGKQLNLVASSWIQFMIHDWVDHEEDNQQVELVAPKGVASECPLKSFRFNKTKEFQTNNTDNGIKIGYVNRRTAWWDGSAIYGNNVETMKKLRTLKDGKLKISSDGLLPVNADGTILSGDVRNIWAGLATLHALFVQEHNAVCDALKKEYPNLKDEELYRYARTVTAAVIAKIHTIDWTLELLKTDTLRAGMRVNWYGLLGKGFKDRFGHTGISVLSGFVGSKKAVDHDVQYSLTEEFVTVYRMHPLLPDKVALRNIDAPTGPNKSPPFSKEMKMEELIGKQGAENLSKIGFTKLMVSMGHQSCGALELWNYPLWLRNLISQNVDGSDRPDPIDLPALEIYRDRERSVARYNDFRRGLLLKPISKWEDLTNDKEAIETLRDVYNDDVEELDILVGMLAETKIKGFAISETAFVIFLLMASRRLEADKYFTSEFNEETYTKKGLEWVNTTETLKDVMNRHYPEMSQKWVNSTSAFTVWDAPPEPYNPIPLYLRLPK